MNAKRARDNCRECGAELKRLDTSYCNNACQRLYEYKRYIARWKEGFENGMKDSGNEVSRYIRKYLFEKYENKCCECGWNKINTHTGNIPLTVEHINGNSKDNREENLKLLCPNCHSLTATYGSLNRGNGREKRRLKILGV